MSNTIFKSPIRWAGSKYSSVKTMLKYCPDSYNKYIEPMFGSGALFFALKPSSAIINDRNRDLYIFLSTLQVKGVKLIDKLMGLKASKDSYYKFRESNPKDDFNRAVRFIYLNRLCWNGVYRVNKLGEFNVPFGNRLPTQLWNKHVLERTIELLSNAIIMNQDFESLVENIEAGDFVYLDPPYPKDSKEDLGFNRYTTNFFSYEDHYRLANFIDKMHIKGAKIMLSSGNNNKILSIYPKYLEKITLNSKSLISCNGNGRKKVKEHILKNY